MTLFLKNKTLYSAFIGHSFHPILLGNKFAWITDPMPGVSMADGFALVYLKYLSL
jgi:hypothetical protein